MPSPSWRRRVAPVVALVSLALAGIGAAAQAQRPASPASTVTFAQDVATPPTYIFPLFNGSCYEFNCQHWFEYLSWRPLYWIGFNGKPVYNPQESLAEPPVFTVNAAGHTVAQITLKSWRWSDGQPVTTRDVRFWMDLLMANKSSWADYIPGEFPDNVTQIRYLSQRTFVITFNAAYSHTWLTYNQLDQIIPIPQHAWDRTSRTGPVGTADTTPAGARAVYKFLNAESNDLASWASNPIWKVVDGPWILNEFTPTTSYIAMRYNPRYSGPTRPHHVTTLVELPFTNDTAEFDALEAGQVDYGYVPLADRSVIPALRHRGFRVVPWAQYAWGGLLYTFAKDNPATPMIAQLYVRQAMAHLANVTAIARDIWHGYSYYASGPVPNPGGANPQVSGYARQDPYPYSVSAAAGLLRAHGWTVRPNGLSTCARPGTGPSECGAGIRRDEGLSFVMLTSPGNVSFTSTWESLKSNFTRVGIQITPHVTTSASLYAACINTKRCPFNMIFDMEFWPFGGPDNYPTGGDSFGCGSYGNYQDICDPALQRLIARTHTASGIGPLVAYQNYMAREQYVLFLPMPVLRLSAIKTGLAGTTPQDPLESIFPELWAWKS